MSKKVFLCTKDKLGINWKCKAGFKSYQEADKYKKDNYDDDCTTTMISISKYWPEYVAEGLVEYKLLSLQDVDFEY